MDIVAILCEMVRVCSEGGEAGIFCRHGEAHITLKWNFLEGKGKKHNLSRKIPFSKVTQNLDEVLQCVIEEGQRQIREALEISHEKRS